MTPQVDIRIGSVVFSKAGRDKNSFLAVTGITEKGISVADGKVRPLARPKLKNPRHLSVTRAVLSSEDLRSDRALKRALAEFQKSEVEVA